MKILRILPLVLIFVGALLLSERPAYGYTDPGTGLLAVQAAGSALVAAGWYLRRRIYLLFHRAEPMAVNQQSDARIKSGEDSRPL